MAKSNLFLLNKDNINLENSTLENITASLRSSPETLMFRGRASEVYAAAFFYSSDERLKENVKALQTSCVDTLNPVTFNWKENGTADVGFIAQEVQAVLPEAVVTGNDGTLSISLTPIVANLVKEIQALKTRIAELEKGE